MTKFLNILFDILKLFKPDPLTYIGIVIFSAGLTFDYFLGFSYKDGNYIINVKTDSTSIFSYMLITVGLVLLVKRYFSLSKKRNILFYGKGLSNMDYKSPSDFISFFNRPSTDPILFKINDSYSSDEVNSKYICYKQLVEDRAINGMVDIIYLGALGSFPYLYLIGSLFRDGYSDKLQLLDYERGKSKWYILPKYKSEDIKHELMYQNENTTIEDELERISEFDDVGIALSYTFKIEKNTIIESFRDKTLFLRLSSGFGHDNLSNIEVQTDLMKKVSGYISRLSGGKKKVHLFVSAQASVCLNLGRFYMNNSHGKIVLHNYDHSSKSYNWSITYEKGNIQA